MTEPQKAERDAFEKVVTEAGLVIASIQPFMRQGKDENEYFYGDVRGLYLVWQAAFEAGRSAGEQELREIIDLIEEWTAKFPLGHAMDLRASDEIHERITQWKEARDAR